MFAIFSMAALVKTSQISVIVSASSTALRHKSIRFQRRVNQGLILVCSFFALSFFSLLLDTVTVADDADRDQETAMLQCNLP
jgi:hypothetical protein